MEEYPVIKPLDRVPLICFEENKAIEKMTEYLNKAGYDVVKREPEIKACPFCGGECILRNHIEYKKPYSVGCMECTYSSCSCETSEEAIRLHNLIAKGE